MSDSLPNKPSGVQSFLRYNISALIATGFDFVVLITLTEVFHVYYVISTAIGALVGTVVAFTLGRTWAFASRNKSKITQGLKYALVASGSLGLNILGVYIFTEWFGLQYVVSKMVVATVIAITYNFTLSKFYIFK